MIGYKALSERWGIPRDRLYVWKHRGRLPEYDFEEGAHLVGWYESTIEEIEEGGQVDLSDNGGAGKSG